MIVLAAVDIRELPVRARLHRMLRAAGGVVTDRWLLHVLDISTDALHVHITKLRCEGVRVGRVRRFGYYLQ